MSALSAFHGAFLDAGAAIVRCTFLAMPTAQKSCNAQPAVLESGNASSDDEGSLADFIVKDDAVGEEDGDSDGFAVYDRLKPSRYRLETLVRSTYAVRRPHVAGGGGGL